MSTQATIDTLKALQAGLLGARNVKHRSYASPLYIAGINDGLDVALNLLALEIKMAEAEADAAPHQ